MTFGNRKIISRELTESINTPSPIKEQFLIIHGADRDGRDGEFAMDGITSLQRVLLKATTPAFYYIK